MQKQVTAILLARAPTMDVEEWYQTNINYGEKSDNDITTDHASSNGHPRPLFYHVGCNRHVSRHG
jgi:hypothetical protein